MRTQLLSRSIYDSDGYGAGPGYTITKKYACPCGKGVIWEEHDEIPGFREHSVELLCDECGEKYVLDVSRGTYNWDLKERTDNSLI